ncbi:MAG: aldehyde dehydrogenase family protein [Erysipelotrichaceae bacterium]|nr:aldehyde dehydrogenase family protein [Erysipelotrichaceae bacterium]
MIPTKDNIHKIVLSQKEYFASGVTLPVSFRIEQLKKLKKAIIDHSKELIDALHEDLNRSDVEAYLTDIGPNILEINEYIKGLKKWAKPERHFSGLVCFPSIFTKVYKMPYGVSLIISPFNFPVLLSLGVLAASIAGGNTSIIKASSKSKACTKAMQEIIKETFDERYITLVDGGHDVADYLLEEKVDKIFYTGSPSVGKHVMEMASKNLVPVTLELGGENGNWAVVRKDADIKDAARKIAFFKLCNSGQICININQVAVEESIAQKFLLELKNEFIRQIGECAYDNPDYPKLISQSAYEKIAKEAEKYADRIYFGGKGDKASQRFNPTIIYPISPDEEIANHEIFGPLLPVVPYKDDEIDDLLKIIASREHGLVLYLFTKNMKWAKKVMSSQQYGGGCVNEVCIHLMVKGVPFNGTGHSGMGAYHGIWGFREFTHPSTVLFGKTHFNLSLREHPYTSKKKNLIKKVLK